MTRFQPFSGGETLGGSTNLPRVLINSAVSFSNHSDSAVPNRGYPLVITQNRKQAARSWRRPVQGNGPNVPIPLWDSPKTMYTSLVRFLSALSPYALHPSTKPQDSTGFLSRGAAHRDGRHSKITPNSTYVIGGFYFGLIFMHANSRYLLVYQRNIHAKNRAWQRVWQTRRQA